MVSVWQVLGKRIAVGRLAALPKILVPLRVSSARVLSELMGTDEREFLLGTLSIELGGFQAL